MARGGIYDQLAGGFARYSVDRRLGGAALREDALRQRAAARRLRPLVAADGRPAGRAGGRRDGRLAAGARCAPSRAASRPAWTPTRSTSRAAAREGAFYAWTPAQLAAVLGADDGAWAARGLHGSPRPARSSTALHPAAGPIQTRIGSPTSGPGCCAAREQRARPARDDKVVAAWNGWLIDSLVQAAMIFDRPDWLAVAIGCGRSDLAAALGGRPAAPGVPGRGGRRRRRGSWRTTPRSRRRASGWRLPGPTRPGSTGRTQLRGGDHDRSSTTAARVSSTPRPTPRRSTPDPRIRPTTPHRPG